MRAEDANDIEKLLEQCSPDELTNILQSLEAVGPLSYRSDVPTADVADAPVDVGDDVVDTNENEAIGASDGGSHSSSVFPSSLPQAPRPPQKREFRGVSMVAQRGSVVGSDLSDPLSDVEHGQEEDRAPAQVSQTAVAPQQLSPAPPSAPLPSGGRRPGARGSNVSTRVSVGVTMSDLKNLLEEHSAGVVDEVRRLLPAADMHPSVTTPLADETATLEYPPAHPAPPIADGSTVDLGVLAQMLTERDEEVQALEMRLQDLRAELATKDERVSQLNDEFDHAVREVRHRQLDLEFQQLKLEERVRGNAELERSLRDLSMRVEEASLHAKHAALDVDMSMGPLTPRSMCAQGTLPWMLRKNRAPVPSLGVGQ